MNKRRSGVYHVVLYGYSIWLLYQDGKEKDISLCSFVPGVLFLVRKYGRLPAE